MANPVGQGPARLEKLMNILHDVKAGAARLGAFLLSKIWSPPDQPPSPLNRMVATIRSTQPLEKIKQLSIAAFDKLSGGKIDQQAAERAAQFRSFEELEAGAKQNEYWDPRPLTAEEAKTELKFAHKGACLVWKKDGGFYAAQKKMDGTIYPINLVNTRPDAIQALIARLNQQMIAFNASHKPGHGEMLAEIDLEGGFFPNVTTREGAERIVSQRHLPIVWHDPATHREVLTVRGVDNVVVHQSFTFRDDLHVITRHYANIENQKRGRPIVNDEFVLPEQSPQRFATNFTAQDYANFQANPTSHLEQDMKQFPRWEGIMLSTPEEARAQLELAQVGAVRFVKNENNQMVLMAKESQGIKEHPWTKENLLKGASFIKQSRSAAFKAHERTHKLLPRLNFVPQSTLSPDLRLYPNELELTLRERFSGDPNFTYALTNLDSKNFMFMLVYRDQETGELQSELVDSGMDLVKVLQSKGYFD